MKLDYSYLTPENEEEALWAIEAIRSLGDINLYEEGGIDVIEVGEFTFYLYAGTGHGMFHGMNEASVQKLNDLYVMFRNIAPGNC